MITPEGVQIQVGQVWRDVTKPGHVRRITEIHPTYVVTEQYPGRKGMATKVAVRKMKAPTWLFMGEQT